MLKVKLFVVDAMPPTEPVKELSFQLPFVPVFGMNLQIDGQSITLRENPKWIGDKYGDGHFEAHASVFVSKKSL